MNLEMDLHPSEALGLSLDEVAEMVIEGQEVMTITGVVDLHEGAIFIEEVGLLGETVLTAIDLPIEEAIGGGTK